MIVDGIDNVTYDELGELELPNGQVRRCKVLEVEGDRAVVQLFEAAQGINLAESKVRFLGHPQQLAVSEMVREGDGGHGGLLGSQKYEKNRKPSFGLN